MRTRLHRARLWLLGERAHHWRSPDGRYGYSAPGTLPVWRRRKPKPLGPRWKNLGYTVDDEDKTGTSWRVDQPCPSCRHQTVIGILYVGGEGQHQHTIYRCTYWPTAREIGADPLATTEPCDWSGWTMPGWREREGR